MKLLFDQNLSGGLIARLDDLYPESRHVKTAGLAEATDLDVWLFAQQQGFTIVSKDSDFQQRSLLFGAPPKVVWLRVGNCSTGRIEALLRAAFRFVAHLRARSAAEPPRPRAWPLSWKRRPQKEGGRGESGVRSQETETEPRKFSRHGATARRQATATDKTLTRFATLEGCAPSQPFPRAMCRQLPRAIRGSNRRELCIVSRVGDAFTRRARERIEKRTPEVLPLRRNGATTDNGDRQNAHAFRYTGGLRSVAAVSLNAARLYTEARWGSATSEIDLPSRLALARKRAATSGRRRSVMGTRPVGLRPAPARAPPCEAICTRPLATSAGVISGVSE